MEKKKVLRGKRRKKKKKKKNNSVITTTKVSLSMVKSFSLVALATALLASPLSGERIRPEYSFSDPSSVGNNTKN